MTLPLTIIGGYLGAGKTTVVNHLLRNADGLRLAILVNEFGALPIDEDLIEAEDDALISIAGGCVCCSYGNDLTLALLDLQKMDPAPDHIVLETSGVALPGAIAGSVSLLQGYSLDGIIVLANAETIEEHARDTYIADTIERQLRDADLVVLNKTDLIPDTERERVAAWLKIQAQGAEVVSATHGVLPLALLLQSFVTRDREAGAGYAPQEHDFETHSLQVDGPMDALALAHGLADATLGLVRAKGFVDTATGERKAVQIVGRRWDVTDAPASAACGLVVIGHKSSLDEEAIKRVLSQTAITNIPDCGQRRAATSSTIRT